MKSEFTKHDTLVEDNTRVLRPKTSKVYAELAEFYEPQNDDFVFCEICKKVEFHGCEKHPPNFSEPDHYDLEISPSSVAAETFLYFYFVLCQAGILSFVETGALS